MIKFTALLFLAATWLPTGTGTDFEREAAELMARSDKEGNGLLDMHSAVRVAEQRKELREDERDWEGAIAQVLDPANRMHGDGAAIQILHARESFGDKRVIRALISRLDYEANMAATELRENPESAMQQGSILNLVANVCRSGQPDLVGFIVKKCIEDPDYYKLNSKYDYISVFKGLKKSGSGENLPELKLLVEKLEKDGKTKAVELGREAIIDITRRSEGVKGGGTTSGKSSNSKQQSEVSKETASDSFTPGKTASVAVIALLVGAAAYFALRRK